MIAPAKRTVENFYVWAFAPMRLVGLSPHTAEQYQVALGHWSRFAGSVLLRDIDDLTLAAFTASLLEFQKPPTVNKTVRHVMSILRFAVERGEIAKLPRVRKIPEALPVPRAFLLDEFATLLLAASREPGSICGLPAGRWWVSLLLAYFDTGARFKALLLTPTRNVCLDTGSLVLASESQKNRRAQCRWLSQQTIEACRLIWSPTRVRMWPWPFTLPIVRKHFKRIAKSAGVDIGDEAGCCFHRIRKTFASYVEAGGKDATRELDHSARSVTLRYLDPRIVRQSAVDVLPRPEF